MEKYEVRDPFYRVDGLVSPGYESVADRFAESFALGRENNAQCCAHVAGRRVVDLWGTSQEARDQNYDGDSLQLVFSCTKAVTSVAFASLVDRGLVSYDDSVCSVWPEFAKEEVKEPKNGEVQHHKRKCDLILSDVLRHESGLATFENKLSSPKCMWTENVKKNKVGEVIERERCRFPPAPYGSLREYHSLTRGFVLNEIFRRADPSGRTIGEYVREEFHDKMGLDLHVGTGLGGGGGKAVFDRAARLSLWGGGYCLLASAMPGFISQRSVLGFSQMASKVLHYAINPTQFPWHSEGDPFDKKCPMYEDQTVLRGELASVNGFCSARGLAALGAHMADGGGDVLGRSAWEELHADAKIARDYGFDVPGLSPTEFTKGGINYYSGSELYQDEPWTERRARGARKGFYGWQGFGGSVFQWKPDKEIPIGFAYAPTLLAWYDPLAQKGAGLQEEVVRCAEERLEKEASS